MTTVPAEDQEQEAAARHLVLSPSVRDEATGALWVHHDLVEAITPFEYETHISPAKADEKLGDVESWAHYVNAFADAGNMPFITWNSKGLKATMDYHQNATSGLLSAGRCDWHASLPFIFTPEFADWSRIATGAGIAQKAAVEFLEDHAVHIVEPDATTLLNLLRKLRGHVMAKADTELRPDGTSHVKFERNSNVSAGDTEIDLPSEITIGIPVLRGSPEPWKLVLKVRTSVDSDARLALRFTMPALESVKETVYAERVAAAKTLLGDAYTILRAAE